MASVIYPSFKEGLLRGDYNLINLTVRAVLIDTGAYTYNSTHDFYNHITGVVGTESSPFTNKTIDNGLFNADDITFDSVTGNSIEAIIIFIDTGNTHTDALVAYIDNAAGLPLTPNGGNINVVWSASGIFQL